jgi:hypothetical protein
MTLNDTMQHYTTVYIQDYTTLYKGTIRHYTTLYKIIQQYIRLYDTIQRYTILYDNTQDYDNTILHYRRLFIYKTK